MIKILYSFRRCPYAIRARMALIFKDIDFELREVDLKNKPKDMLEFSPKGTVPVLILEDGRVIDESLDILDFVLDYKYDELTEELIKQLTTDFVPALHRFKYPDRFDGVDMDAEKNQLVAYLSKLDKLLEKSSYLRGESMQKADIAIFPLIRQLARANEAWFHSVPLKNVTRWFYTIYDSPLHQTVMKVS